jgi:quercetin dioxygenase-like cupin family protein
MIAFQASAIACDDRTVEPQFVKLTDLRSFELAPGVTGQPLFGAGAMINLIEFEPGAEVPTHSHPHEQLGICLRGTQVLVVAGVDHPVGPMEAYAIPGGVEHSARSGPEGATVVDVFQPVREDYKARYEA